MHIILALQYYAYVVYAGSNRVRLSSCFQNSRGQKVKWVKWESVWQTKFLFKTLVTYLPCPTHNTHTQLSDKSVGSALLC